MKKIYLLLLLVVFSSLNAMDRLPQRGLDVFFGENERGYYCRLVDYGVTQQKLESVTLVNYEDGDDLDIKLQGVNEAFARYGIKIGENKVQVFYGFNPRIYIIRVSGVDSITGYLSHENFLYSPHTVYDVSKNAGIPYSIYKSETTVDGSFLADLLFHQSPKSMGQKNQSPFLVTFLRKEGEEKLSLEELERRGDPLVDRLGQIATELTLTSRGYDQIISCDMDGVDYSIFKYTPPREDQGVTYFITTSVCSKKHETACKIAETKLTSQNALALTEKLSGISSLRDEIKLLEFYAIENSHSVFLFTHRTVKTGKSQSFIQTTDDLKLEKFKSPEILQKLELLRSGDESCQKKAEEVSEFIERLRKKVRDQRANWDQPSESEDESESIEEQTDSDGGSSSS